MNYLREDLRDDEFRLGLVLSGIGMSLCVPGVLLFVIPHFLHFRAAFFLVFIALASLVGSYVGVKLWKVDRTGSTVLPAGLTFTLASSLQVATALMSATAGGPSGIYRLPLLSFVLLLGIIGDKKMVMWFLVTSGICLSVSCWWAGDRGWTFVGIVVVQYSVAICMLSVIRYPVHGVMAMDRSRVSMQLLTDAALESETVEEGLERCLPMVQAAFPVDHVVAYLKKPGDVGFTVAGTWPNEAEDDVDRPWDRAFAQAANIHKAVFSDGWCYLPIGFTVAGDLALVMHMTTSKEVKDRRGTFTNQAAEALAASFMRLAGQVASISGMKGLTRLDPLTGLANRRALSERSETEMVHADRSHTPLSVAMIDIDHFKEYNDIYGHVAGDVLLADMAKLMAQRARSQDFVARYGGEEFCMLLSETDIDGAYALIDSLREMIRLSDNKSSVSISAGVAAWNGYEDFEDLVHRADIALYAAKNGGRNRVLSYEGTMEGQTLAP